MAKINLGDEARDPLTGVKGTVVMRSEWLWGCVRIGIQPKGTKDGKPLDESYFDEDRLEVVKPRSPKRKAAKPKGGPSRPTGARA